MNRSRETGRIWNGKPFVATRLSRMLSDLLNMNPDGLKFGSSIDADASVDLEPEFDSDTNNYNVARNNWNWSMPIGILLASIPSHVCAQSASGLEYALPITLYFGIAITAICGTVGGSLLMPECRIAGIMGGLAASLSSFWIGILTLQGVQSVTDLPWPGYSPLMLIGLIMGVFVAWFVRRTFRSANPVANVFENVEINEE